MPSRIPSKALVVFAKPARPGHVKTRLRGVLSAREAAEAHVACLRDTTRMAGSVGGARKCLHVAGSYPAAQRLAARVGLSRRWRLGVQVGRTLGERLEFAIQSLLASGFRKVVVIGTDTPWMGAARVFRAFRLLDYADVVLGPAADGGYYLIGVRRAVPEMFRGVAWGTARVFAQTTRALRQAGIRYRLLKRDFDLDRPKDLARLVRLRSKRKLAAPALRRWIYGWELTTGSSRRRRRVRRRRRRPPDRE